MTVIHLLGISLNPFSKISMLLALIVYQVVCFSKDGKAICILSSSLFMHFRSNESNV